MLQNRVTPDAQLVAEPWRGEMMGNRGGRIHDPNTKSLLKRKWASKRWISCVTQFKNRQRVVMGESYTELFFLDEVSALACGHRPCFECRRQAANDFAIRWADQSGMSDRAQADEMDRILHQERIGPRKTINIRDLSDLPHGAMVQDETSTFFAKSKHGFLRWDGAGYKSGEVQRGQIKVLTPPSILTVLRAGYQPLWHSSVTKVRH